MPQLQSDVLSRIGSGAAIFSAGSAVLGAMATSFTILGLSAAAGLAAAGLAATATTMVSNSSENESGDAGSPQRESETPATTAS